MPEEVASLEISGIIFKNWESLTIQRTLADMVDAFSFSSPFDPTHVEMVKSVRPFGYQPARIAIDGEVILTGRLEQVVATISAGSQTVNLQGRSPAGSMLDCSFDPPYQYDGQKWIAIAKKLAKPFSIVVDSTIDTGPIQTAVASSGDSPADFLASLAKSEGLLTVSSPSGAIRLRRIVRTHPVASIVEGVGSFVSSSLVADATKRFSKTHAVHSMSDWKPVEVDSQDASVSVYRPRIITVKTVGSNIYGSVEKAANWARSQSIAESCPVDVVVTGWRTDSGHVWEPGDFVTLLAPGSFILREAEFIIEGVSLELTSGGMTTSLHLVLPEAYLGGVHLMYPWDDPKVTSRESRR
jgi:prophage tail gpP-like protein